MVTPEQLDFFRKNGYLIVRDFLSKQEVQDLQGWAQEVHDWKATDDADFMPYEEVNAQGQRVLCRTENYADSHYGFGTLLRGKKLLGLLEELSEEPMLLFKEKINYKLAGSGGFAPHIDAVAYTHIKDVKHLTILLAVDESNLKNGGLEVVNASHAMNIPINEDDHCIQSSWVDSQEWTPVELKAGQLLIFGSYLAHRSGPNNSEGHRKAVYATYNCKREGDLHRSYYEDRKNLWPATHMRKNGEKYEEGALRYGFGSPMLSVDVGRQINHLSARPSPFTNMGLPNPLTPSAVAKYVLSVLEGAANTPYIGEPISQTEHSLQCGALAASASPPADDSTQVAALLHDIGQFAPEDDLKHVLAEFSGVQNMGSSVTDSVGRIGHEVLGARFLLALGFPQKVARLVESHVAAKRFLCATEPEYHARLSDASKQSLVYQGGPMAGEEKEAFAASPWCKDMCRLRKWDDEAKEEDLEVPGLMMWEEKIKAVLQT
ncbi:PhyH-domain-containing protein [Thozetella sp. PMI_491]|nr:PhyH-domain-containing protein [Thozetella sp. PMI_491]